MCLFPKLIYNRKYKANKKNNGLIPQLTDERVRYVAVGCGRCEQCLKKKAREWQVRLSEELKVNNSGKFVTLTFSNESLIKLCRNYNITESNAVATIAVKLFLGRWRKKFKNSVKHWLITEMGHENTERIHLHGLLFTNENEETIRERWEYGNIYIGDYVNEKTINYIIKYCSKIDDKHKNFIPKILTSPGIGKSYISTFNAKKNTFKGINTNEAYKLQSGYKVALPIYYRNKLYNDEERENLWINKLDDNVRYLNGIKYHCNNEDEEIAFLNSLEYQQKLNNRKGYGNDSDEWKKEKYNITLNMLKKAAKTKEYKKKIKE